MKKRNFNKLLIFINILSFLLALTTNLWAISGQNSSALSQINKKKECPDDLQSLANALVINIPNYANRVIQKSRKLSRNIQSIPIYVITASQAEFEPLPLSQHQYQENKNEAVKQVFFTTLERQYLRKDYVIETQNYHWLLLTKTSQGWQLVMIFSRFGTSNNGIPSPKQDTSNGIMGQAIKLWLRDCNAIK